jgi:lysophosphatidic acid acyltransferase / lysophosphatidylinositol acyltransferase
MAVPLVLVGLPIGLLFLLSGLIVNTIQVISLSRLTLP